MNLLKRTIYCTLVLICLTTFSGLANNTLESKSKLGCQPSETVCHFISKDENGCTVIETLTLIQDADCKFSATREVNVICPDIIV